jgi:hypothetical protein
VTDPPAFSTAATADFEAPHTEKMHLGLQFTMAEQSHAIYGARNRPALISAAASTVAPASSLPGIDSPLHASRLTSCSLSWNGLLKPRLAGADAAASGRLRSP